MPTETTSAVMSQETRNPSPKVERLVLQQRSDDSHDQFNYPLQNDLGEMESIHSTLKSNRRLSVPKELSRRLQHHLHKEKASTMNMPYSQGAKKSVVSSAAESRPRMAAQDAWVDLSDL